MAYNQGKKKKCNGKPLCPLPIPISQITKQPVNTGTWNYYRGYLKDSNIVIKCNGDAHAIYSMGHFGKGCLSKSNPELSNIEKNPSPEEDVSESSLKTSEVQDNSYLTLEESYFLSFALGCLFIFDDDKPLNIAEQWKKFCAMKPNFPFTYAAYHHFRTKGWVPREGIKYGTDFILYKYGPAFYHASYAVKVIIYKDNQTKSVFTWQTLAGLNRLANSVSKELLLCHIIPNDKNLDFNSPNCLKDFQIHEIVFSRWTSAKEREKEEKDIDAQY